MIVSVQKVVAPCVCFKYMDLKITYSIFVYGLIKICRDSLWCICCLFPNEFNFELFVKQIVRQFWVKMLESEGKERNENKSKNKIYVGLKKSKGDLKFEGQGMNIFSLGGKGAG